jgi:7-cyano-7-deazaguanine synthase in queuosine biosynthesis
MLLFSGGVDSTAALLLSRLSVDYPYIHSVLFVENTGKNTNAQKDAISNIKLISKDMDYRIHEYKMSPAFGHNFEKEDFEVPGRNLHFATLAANFGADNIFFAIEKDQDFLYDRSPEFFEHTSSLLSKVFRKKIQTLSYFPELTKAKAVVKALESTKHAGAFNLATNILSTSFSCYSPVDFRNSFMSSYLHCGKCEACVRRFIAFDYSNTYFSLKKSGEFPLIEHKYSSSPQESAIFAEYANLKSVKTPELIKREMVEYFELKASLKKAESAVPKSPAKLAASSVPTNLKLKAQIITESPKMVRRKSGFFNRSLINFISLDRPDGGLKSRYMNAFCIITAGKVSALSACIGSIKARVPDALIVVYFNPAFHLTSIENELNFAMVKHMLSTGYVGSVPICKETLLFLGEDPASLPFCRNTMYSSIKNYLTQDSFVTFLDDDTYLTEHYTPLYRTFLPKKPYLLGGHGLCFYKNDNHRDTNNIHTCKNMDDAIVSDNNANGYYQGYCMIGNKALFDRFSFDTDYSFWYEDADFTKQVKTGLQKEDNLHCFSIPAHWLVHENHGTQKDSEFIFTPESLKADADVYENKWSK